MKILLGLVGLVSSLTLAVTHAPVVAPAPATAAADLAPVTAPADDQTCSPVWVCDEPYAVFSSLAACRASGCSVQCSYEGMSCH